MNPLYPLSEYTKGIKSILYLTITIIHVANASRRGRTNPQGVQGMPSSFYDYDSCTFPPPNIPSRSHDDFSLLRRLGAGKFSDVFEAVEHSNHNENSSTDNHDFINNYNDDITPSSLCVIKCLKPVSERKIKREILILSHASELPNLARLRAVVVPEEFHVRNGLRSDEQRIKRHEGQMPSLVLEHAGPNSRWLSHGPGCDHSNQLTKHQVTKEQSHQKNYEKQEEPFYLTEYEIKYYLFHLLVALDCLHARGIMHRDVKPRNVLINRRWPPPSEEGDVCSVMRDDDPLPLMLIDLGLADFYLPSQKYNVRVASRHYKAPELLLGNGFYDYGVDMWGIGCILAGLLLRREPMFRGKDNVDQLGQIVAFLGKKDLYQYCDKYGIQLTPELQIVVEKYTRKNNPSGRRKSWLTLLGSTASKPFNKKQFIDSQPCPVPSRDGLNLIDKLLVYDHEERLTAKEAMCHPFFDAVRDKVRMEISSRGSNLLS